MPRRPFATTLASVLVAVLLLPSAARAVVAPVPATVPLTTGWQHVADRGNVGVSHGLWRPDSRADWTPVTVPSVFSAVPLKDQFRGTVGWYRVAFTAPPRTPGFTWGVHFDQVRRTARVWLNGVELGRHDDPYVPFELGVRRALKPGARNVLVVRVDNRKGGEPREGWWNWGGITRPVSLVPRGGLVLHGPGVLSDVRCADGGGSCTAAVLLDGVLENTTDHPVRKPLVRLALAGGPSGVVRARPLAPGEQTRVQLRLPVRDPQLWSPQSPHLYDVTITTSASDRVQQVDRWRTGLREVKVRGGMLTLNGRQLALRGTSIQEDVPGRGPALTDADIAQIVAELKAVHANVTRAHYLLNPRLLSALDAAGIMVWSQAPIYHRDRLLQTPAERAAALATVRGTVLQARNHPSVITHSVANELSAVPDTVPGTRIFLHAARRLVGSLDPTLPVSVDLLSYPGFGVQQAYREYDLLGINSYFGWYPGKAAHSTAKLSDLGPYLDHMRSLYPTQGLVVTEFGAESTFAGPPGEKQTFAFQTQYVKDVLKVVEDRPFVGGAIYWTLREFAVKPDWDGGAKIPGVVRNSFHHKGLITYAGRRKPAWGVAEKDFAQTPLYRNVSAAVAADVPGARDGHGGTGVIVAIALAMLLGALLLIDSWATAGLLGRRRRAIPEPAAGEGNPEPAGARAA